MHRFWQPSSGGVFLDQTLLCSVALASSSAIGSSSDLWAGRRRLRRRRSSWRKSGSLVVLLELRRVR
uniref:Putative secreted protein n=1 Tax=Anopheles marajoara TaxID=58244 RepID=A0A2M4CFF4_9DIPT